MSHYLVELYTPNAAWLALPHSARDAFLATIGGGMAALADAGIEVLALGEVDPATALASGHRFVGIWRFNDAAGRDALLAGIAARGWYDYFDHVNAATAGGGLAGHLDALAMA